MKSKKTTLPKELTTITTVSKTLALILFVSLPFIGFAYGIKYSNLLKTPETSKVIEKTKPQSNKGNNIITKEYTKNSVDVTLNVTGTIESLNVTNMEIPYRYKLVLKYPITDTDAISDASGISKPKTEYVLYTKDEKILQMLSNTNNKNVRVIGKLEWGFAETRQLTIESINLL